MKNLKILQTITVIILILFNSCDVNLEGDDGSGNTIIRVKVVDNQDKKALERVQLTLSYSTFMGMSTREDLSPLTDSLGSVRIEYVCMKDYSYSLSFSKEVYLYNDYPKSIEKGKDNYFYIEMVKTDTTKTKK